MPLTSSSAWLPWPWPRFAATRRGRELIGRELDQRQSSDQPDPHGSIGDRARVRVEKVKSQAEQAVTRGSVWVAIAVGVLLGAPTPVSLGAGMGSIASVTAAFPPSASPAGRDGHAEDQAVPPLRRLGWAHSAGCTAHAVVRLRVGLPFDLGHCIRGEPTDHGRSGDRVECSKLVFDVVGRLIGDLPLFL